MIGGGGKFCSNSERTRNVFEENHFDPIWEEETKDTSFDGDINGLGCTDNKTLNFYALDIKTQKAFGEKMGLEGQNSLKT